MRLASDDARGVSTAAQGRTEARARGRKQHWLRVSAPWWSVMPLVEREIYLEVIALRV